MIGTEKQRVGIVGHAAVDAKFPHLRFELIDGTLVRVAANGQWIDVRTLEPVQYSKTRAVIPAGLWAYAADWSCGGGGPNSVMGAMRAVPDLKVRYLESTRPDEVVTRALSFPTVDMEALNLRATPRNAILGGADKLILKSALEEGQRLGDGHFARVDWVADCSWVLANSLKDREILVRLAEKARAGATRLCIVFTGSPSPEFTWRHVLPCASAVVGASDEVPAVMFWRVRAGLPGAIRTFRRLQAGARAAMIFVTMGADGVLAGGPYRGCAYHVRLSPVVWERLQSLVASDPTRLSGVGDAFAGGLAAYLVSGRSTAGCFTALPAPAAAAAAGTSAAARWLGFGGPLRASDFLCTPAAVVAVVA
ncbi:hypothetical protein [Paludibaculum fermentans]|uniref:hypothetical protein n=1 Tax=Paludibaculum fermentans TaxID=1473598 RepID=UPI003EBCA015